MESKDDFRKRVYDALADIDKDVLDYHDDEFWMIRAKYQALEFYAQKHRLFNTLIALPLARGLHNGTYRKLPIMRSGQNHHPPYMIHCLTVCKMLADLWLPLDNTETDILLASALCHDMIEDIPFPDGGRELYKNFHLDYRVYETVLLVSKRHDFTLEEEQAYFKGIMENKLALLIKLSDRGHNVTDLYNMSDKKIREYVGETRAYFLPMCAYGREHYPELFDVMEIMQDQLICLTKTVDMMAKKHEKIQWEQNRRLSALRNEHKALRTELNHLRVEEYNE